MVEFLKEFYADLNPIVIRKIVLYGAAIFIVQLIRKNQKKTKQVGRIKSVRNKISVDITSSSEIKNNIRDFHFERIKSLINDQEYVLVKSKKSGQGFEITFKNYEEKLFKLRRLPTYVKVSGLINSDDLDLEFSSWSDRYEYGQNSHNHEFLTKFQNIVGVSDIRPRNGSGGHVVNDGKWHNLVTEKTNEELLTILNEKRDDYNHYFIRAAEMEIEKRSRSEN